MTILVIGSSGFLGRVVTTQLMVSQTVTATHTNNSAFPTSVRYDFFADGLAAVVEMQRIQTVIFTAHVEQQTSVDVIQQRMKRVLSVCQKQRFVYLSSDGIFNGEKGLYTERDMPQPCTRYGRNLLTCERLVQQHPNYCIIKIL